jgi:putative DNA primase/helicase
LLFVELFKGNVRFIEEWKSWLVWDGKRWTEVSDAAMLPLARAATEHMFAWSGKLAEDRREGLRKHALSTQKASRLQSMRDLAKGEAVIRISPDKLDADPWLLGCPNGSLDLRTGELRAPRLDDFITKTVTIAYDPQAACPNWRAFLAWAMQGDRDTIEHLQRVAGYALTGRVGEEKLFALFGGGNNGKTTFVMMLVTVLGAYAGKARKGLLLKSQGEKGEASPDVAALQGKRLVVVSETDEGCVLAEAQVKEITANERVPARRLYGLPFDFDPSHKIVLLTNHRPFVKGTDVGIWRRLDIVEFGAEISEEEKDESFRDKKLAPELAGIFRWAVEGAQKWARDGLKPSQAVRKATDDYRSESDFVGQWLEECCERDAAAFAPRAVAYGNYAAWTKLEQHPHCIGPRKFGEELHGRGFTRDRTALVRGFHGLKIKNSGMAMKIIS